MLKVGKKHDSLILRELTISVTIQPGNMEEHWSQSPNACASRSGKSIVKGDGGGGIA
jgi:hypothetical protein